MTDSAPFDLQQFDADLGAARGAMQAFGEECIKVGDKTGGAFERAGARIARAFGRAAADGETSFKRMAKVVLEELAKLALDRIFTQGAGKQLPFFGARAAGGAVNVGGAYLVGERGPELFVPRQAGAITASAAAPVAVHFHFGPGADAASVARHQGQIAAQIARAVAYGRRNL